MSRVQYTESEIRESYLMVPELWDSNMYTYIESLDVKNFLGLFLDVLNLTLRVQYMEMKFEFLEMNFGNRSWLPAPKQWM